MPSVFGLSVFVLLFGGILYRTACRWRRLAKSYSQPVGDALESRRMQSAVLLGFGGYNSLKGILTIGVHKTGVSFRVLAPFALFHSPLFIPYGDIRGWQTTWYLDAPSTELEFSRAPGVKMVVPTDQAEWIGSHAGHRMILRTDSPPNGKTGQGWRAFILINLGLYLIMAIWAASIYFFR